MTNATHETPDTYETPDTFLYWNVAVSHRLKDEVRTVLRGLPGTTIAQASTYGSDTVFEIETRASREEVRAAVFTVAASCEVCETEDDEDDDYDW